ncbi:MAG: NAD(P)H-dependent oxidoreductase subunit E [Pseudomonadota bacterium]
MSDDAVKPINELLSSESIAEIDKWIAKYPADKKRSAVMGALMVAQDANKNYLTQELMDAIALYLEIPKISVYEVATFYGMYNLKPVGENIIDVCTNISCQLRGSDQIVAHLESKLGVKLGETTPDGRFTIREVECQAACCGAPMACINKTYHENLTPEKVDSILDELE